MAMEVFDPFITYATSADLSGHIWSDICTMANDPYQISAIGSAGNTPISFPAAARRFSNGGGIQIVAGGGNSSGIYVSGLSPIATRYITFSAYFTDGSPGNMGRVIASFVDSGIAQLSFTLLSGGSIGVYRNGPAGSATPLLATLGSPVSLNAWHRFEFFGTIDPTVGHAECRVDGISLGSYTGNLRYTANSSANEVFIGAGHANDGGYCYITDVAIFNGSGAAPNTWMGDKRFYALLPSGDGVTQNWSQNTATWSSATAVPLGTTILDTNSNLQRVTSISGTGTTAVSAPTWNVTVTGTTTDNAGGNQVVWTNLGTQLAYKLVNESYPDDLHSYVSDNTIGHTELFTFPSLPAGAQNIVGVGTVLRAWKNDSGTRSIRAAVKSAATIADNGSDYVLSTTPGSFEGFFATDPATSTTWTASGVNAVSAGPEVTV